MGGRVVVIYQIGSEQRNLLPSLSWRKMEKQRMTAWSVHIVSRSASVPSVSRPNRIARPLDLIRWPARHIQLNIRN